MKPTTNYALQRTAPAVTLAALVPRGIELVVLAPLRTRLVGALFFLLSGIVALGDAPPDIALTVPVRDDPKNCFPHDGSPITITGGRVTSIQLPRNRKIAFAEGLVPIRVNGKWGCMDSRNRIAIAPRFDQARQFNQERALVVVDGRYGYIDRGGSYVTEPQFSWGFDFHRGVASVRSGDRWGLIDLEGDWVVTPRFRRLDLLVGGLLAETYNGEQGFVDTRGTFIQSGPLGGYYQPPK